VTTKERAKDVLLDLPYCKDDHQREWTLIRAFKAEREAEMWATLRHVALTALATGAWIAFLMAVA